MENNLQSQAYLKCLLAKLLPNALFLYTGGDGNTLHWHASDKLVDNTQLLYVCYLVEETLLDPELHAYGTLLHKVAVDKHYMHPCYYAIHASWEERTIALAKIKGLIN